MFVYVDGPFWFVGSVCLLMTTLLVLSPRVKRAVKSLLGTLKKKDIALEETKELPTPKKAWERTAAPVGDDSGMSLTAMNHVPIPSYMPKAVHLARLPETPLPATVMHEQSRPVSVKVFGNHISTYDQFGQLMTDYSGRKALVGEKVMKLIPANVWEEMNSVDAVVDRALMRRVMRMEEMSPIE